MAGEDKLGRNYEKSRRKRRGGGGGGAEGGTDSQAKVVIRTDKSNTGGTNIHMTLAPLSFRWLAR